MKLVEQHIIKRTDPRFQRIDEAAFASKNLWNAANYLVRQSFIFEGKYLNTVAVFHQIKSHEAYQALPRKVSNQVLLQLQGRDCPHLQQTRLHPPARQWPSRQEHQPILQ